MSACLWYLMTVLFCRLEQNLSLSFSNSISFSPSFHQIQKGWHDVQHASADPRTHSESLRLRWRRGDGPHVVWWKASVEPGHQQAARWEAGPSRVHHPVPRAFAPRHKPRRDRDRLRDAEAINAAWAGEIRHDVSEEETSEAIRLVKLEGTKPWNYFLDP